MNQRFGPCSLAQPQGPPASTRGIASSATGLRRRRSVMLRQSDECVVWALRMLSSAISHRAVKGGCSRATTITGILSSLREQKGPAFAQWPYVLFW